MCLRACRRFGYTAAEDIQDPVQLRDLDLVEDSRKEKFVFYHLKDKNPLLNHILEFISENIADYPELENDRKTPEGQGKVHRCLLTGIP